MKIKEAYIFTHKEVKRFHNEQEASAVTSIIFNDLGFSTADRLLRSDDELDIDSEARIQMVLSGLEKHLPIQYILGYTWFMDLKIEVNPDVLIPRPETEELTDLIIKENHKRSCSMLDIGTGSGCIALSLKKNIRGAKVVASDISMPALETAKQNASLNQVDINFIHDDILHPDDTKYDSLYDLIVSNPPYVTETDKKQMHKNVLNHEPSLALYVSDSDPLIYYLAIERFASRHLKSGGRLYLEINENLGNGTRAIFSTCNYLTIEVIKDMQGKDRFIKAIKE